MMMTMTATEWAEALLAKKMDDPMWRLCSGQLYKIIPNARLGLIPYQPRPEHIEIFKALIERDVKQLMLLKARRPGFSTALGLYVLDFCIFNPGVQCSLIDQNAADATRKLDKIVCVALDNLPDWLRKRLKIGAECGPGGTRSGEHLSLSLDGKQRSDFYAGMNARGGTNHFLWVSEWGVIQNEDESRSAKIRSGALPSARDGVTVVETTWAGGKRGDVWELIEDELDGKASDWEIQFCAWWKDPRNTDEVAQMSEVALRYFEKTDAMLLAEEGVVLTPGQKRWWAQEKRKQGIYMPRENPSFLRECWEAPAPGSIYGESIDIARTQGRICRLPVSNHALVHTFWDLGAPRQTRVVYYQEDGPWNHIIDVDLGTDELLVHRVARMRDKPYRYGCHYFPHDAKQTKATGHTLATDFAAAWLKVDAELVGQWDARLGKLDFTRDYKKAGIRFVPRTDEEAGINNFLEMFPTLRFDSERCGKALEELAMYRRPAVKPGSRDEGTPIHDFASHLADACRTLSDSWRHNLIERATPHMMQSNSPWEQDRRGFHNGLKILSGPRRGASHGIR